MRTHEDALRSLKRHIGLVLDDLDEVWDVQLARTEPLERPGAVVRRSGPAPESGSAYVRETQADYEIFIYPEGAEGQAIYSALEAERVANTVARSISAGRLGARSMRIPAFDYDDIPWDQGQDDDAEPYDYLVVSNLRAGDPIPDPDDDTLFTVVIDLRLMWRADGDLTRFEGAVLQDVGTPFHQG